MIKKELYSALKVYAFTWVLIVGAFLFMTINRGSTISESFGFFQEVLVSKTFLIAAHSAFLMLYLLFLIFRYFYRMYHKKGVKTAVKYASFGFLTPVLVLFLGYKMIAYNNTNEGYAYLWDASIENNNNRSKNNFAIDGKHRGMSVFGWRVANEMAIDALVRNNIEWVAVTPFFYQKNEQTKAMNMPDTIGTWSRRDSIFIKSIKQLHEKGIRVNLKPHLWMNDGWRSNINFPSDAAWATWFESYRENMLHYSKMAALTNVEMLCIGTELRTSLKKQPGAWLSLIQEIKAIYTGKLTYAANWDDDFEQIDFWAELDYVGVQAYYPLTKKRNPDLKTIKKGWQRHINKLKKIADLHNKPILFTEVGYKSEASATIKPWEWDSAFSSLSKKKSDETQQLAYEALFQSLWKKDWFKGTYIWQWDTRSTEENALKNLDFSPRFKPAENTIAKWYGTPSK